MRKSALIRIRIISVIIALCAFGIITRLFFVQIVHGKAYLDEGERQYVHTVRDLYKRGSIFLTAKNGDKVSAATIQTGYLLAVDPTKILDPQHTYEALSSIIPINQTYFLERAVKKPSTYQEISQKITNDEAKKIEALSLQGVRLYRNQWRYYPGNSLSARTIGFVGYDEDTIVGKYGLERYYNDTLERTNEHLSVNFFAELFSSIGNTVFSTKETSEGNIVTSIEPTVARTLDKVLEDTQKRYQSKHTGGIIIDPTNGDIIALNIVPSFDLNDRSGLDIETFQNPLVENVYELGSIIKPLTVAAGLDSRVITPHSTYFDPGCIKLSDYTICNYDKRGRGTVPVQQILSQSLNTGVAHIASLMGKDRFRKYFYGLKLGSETGIDLPNEARGLVKNLESSREVEYATASFGQGIALTPIAAVRALSTLANGGVLITPHLVTRIEYESGKTHEVGFPVGDRVFSKETSDEITKMLVEVVDKALKNGKAKNEHYSIAAKTGTAQIADSSKGGYYPDKYLHSFFGYFPAYKPRFLIFLYTVEPQGVQYASETLTDPFIELVNFLINYYNIQPDR